MKEGEFLTSYCTRTLGIDVRFAGQKMDDTTIVEKVLCSLTPVWLCAQMKNPAILMISSLMNFEVLCWPMKK